MNGKRVALLVGCSDYQDRKFHPLPAPAQDLDALRPVLTDPAIGDFTVSTLLNQPSAEVREQIEIFFANHKPDDHLLLYFSCHGVLDPRGRLYFVAADTKKELLDATGISARWVKEQMDHSRSQRIVLLLDCCYSGAFTKGLRRGSAGTEEILEQLGGRGRVVITASDKLEHAYDSEFTNAVVVGLETGAADLDGDGQVSVHELYDYVYDQVRRSASSQTPTMSTDEMRGQFYLAKNPHAPLPLPATLEQALTSEVAWERLWAVDGLRRLLTSDASGGQKRTARQTLARLHGADTDRDVQQAASEALSAVSRPPGTTGHQHRLPRWLAGVGLALAVVVALVVATVWPSSPAPAKPPLACSPNTKPADGVLSFGTLLPKTGTFIYTGPALDAGVHLAMKDINEAGGIPGVEVKLDDANQRDEGNNFSGDTASQSTGELLSGGVDVIIGPATSAVAFKVIDKVICAGVIMFSPSNTSPLLTTYPNHGLYFRTASPSVVEGSILGKVVVADGNSTAVIISRNDPYGNYAGKEVEKTIRKSGGRILDSFSYDPNSPDLIDMQRVKTKNPDAIVVIGFTESAKILKKIIEERLGPGDKRVYGLSNMSNTLAGQVNPQNPGVLKGMRGILPAPGDEVFVKRLREANPGLQDVTYAAQAYDTVVITALAAAVAGTDAPAAIAKEIDGVTKTGERCTSFAACMTLVKNHKAIAYDGPSGPLRFTDHGEPSSATYNISEIQADGTVKTLRSETVTLSELPTK
ncbi:MAG: ABC transporter substrate-binding protein [Pseudonocardiaceae bacterium]